MRLSHWEARAMWQPPHICRQQQEGAAPWGFACVPDLAAFSLCDLRQTNGVSGLEFPSLYKIGRHFRASRMY